MMRFFFSNGSFVDISCDETKQVGKNCLSLLLNGTVIGQFNLDLLVGYIIMYEDKKEN